MEILSATNFSKSYPDRPNLIHGEEFRVAKGQVVVLTGPSGSGKSTFLRCLMGLAPFDRGEVTFEGELLQERYPQRFRQSILYIPQNPRRDLSDASILEFFQRPFHYQTHSQLNFSMEGATKILQDLVQDLAHGEKILNSGLHRLSGGETQLLHLVRGLSLSPQLLILDEPFSQMDRKLATRVQESLIKRVKELKTSFVFVTHHPLFLANHPTTQYQINHHQLSLVLGDPL